MFINIKHFVCFLSIANFIIEYKSEHVFKNVYTMINYRSLTVILTLSTSIDLKKATFLFIN